MESRDEMRRGRDGRRRSSGGHGHGVEAASPSSSRWSRDTRDSGHMLHGLHEQLAATLVSYLSAPSTLPSSLHLHHHHHSINTINNNNININSASPRPLSISSQSSSSFTPYSPTRHSSPSPSPSIPSRPASLLVNLSASTSSSASSSSLASCRPTAAATITKRSSLLRFSTDLHSFNLENVHTSSTALNTPTRPCTISGRPASLSIEHDERFRNIADMMAASASGYTTAEASDIIAARRRSKRQSMRLANVTLPADPSEEDVRNPRSHSIPASSAQHAKSAAQEEAEERPRRRSSRSADSSDTSAPTTSLTKHIAGPRLTRRGQVLCFGLLSCLVAYPPVSALSASASASVLIGGPSAFPTWLPASLAEYLADPRTPLGALLAGLAALWAASPPHSLLKSSSDGTDSRLSVEAVDPKPSLPRTLQDDMHLLLTSIQAFIAESDSLDEQVRQIIEQFETVGPGSNADRAEIAIEGMIALRTLLHETARHLEAAPQADDVVDEDERDRLIEMYITPVATSFAANVVSSASNGDTSRTRDKARQSASVIEPARSAGDDINDSHSLQSAGLQSPSWREERDRQRRSWASSPRSSPRACHGSPVFPNNAFDDDACLRSPGQNLTPKRSLPDWNTAQTPGSPLAVPAHFHLATGRRLSYQHETSGSQTPRLTAPELRRAHSLKVQTTAASGASGESVSAAPTLYRSKSARAARPVAQGLEALRGASGPSASASTPAAAAPTTPRRSVHAAINMPRAQSLLSSPTTVAMPPPSTGLLASPRILSQVECTGHDAPTARHQVSEKSRHSVALALASPMLSSRLTSLSTAASDLRLARRSLMCYVLAIRQARSQTVVCDHPEEPPAVAATRLFVCRISSSLQDLAGKTRGLSSRMNMSASGQSMESATHGPSEAVVAEGRLTPNRNGLRISTNGIPGSWPARSSLVSTGLSGDTPPSGLRKRRSMRPTSGTSLYTHAEQPEHSSPPSAPLLEHQLEAIRSYVDAASRMRQDIARLTNDSAAEEQQLLDAVAALLNQHGHVSDAHQTMDSATSEMLEYRAASMKATIQGIEEHWKASQTARSHLFPAGRAQPGAAATEARSGKLPLQTTSISIPMVECLSNTSVSSAETLDTPAPSTPAAYDDAECFPPLDVDKRLSGFANSVLANEHWASATFSSSSKTPVDVPMSSKQRRRAALVSIR